MNIIQLAQQLLRNLITLSKLHTKDLWESQPIYYLGHNSFDLQILSLQKYTKFRFETQVKL